MKLAPLLQGYPPNLDFAGYLRAKLPLGMPPLDVRQLGLKILAENARGRVRTVAIDGEHALLIGYKGHEGAVLGMDELGDGDEWRIKTVSRARSPKAYRVATGLHWQRALAHGVRQAANRLYAQVKRITMPEPDTTPETASRHYQLVQAALKMRHSASERLFVVDISR